MHSRQHSEVQIAQDVENQFAADLVELAPFLKSFARSLSRNTDTAEDLVQETLLSAWKARASYKPGTNLKAWLCIILRNKFYSDGRRAWRRMPWDDEAAERLSGREPEQVGAVDLSDAVHAMEFMPAHQREALTLIGAGGFSYREAAEIVHCDPGTLKSRVTRARKALSSLLEGRKELPRGPHLPGREAAEEMMAELARLALGAGKVGLETAQRAAA
jgi:RNA polymerase sigma-70 factor (ECF subfamily)